MAVHIDVFSADDVVAEIRACRDVTKLLGSDDLIMLVKVEVKVVVADHEEDLVEDHSDDYYPYEHIPVSCIAVDIDI